MLPDMCDASGSSKPDSLRPPISPEQPAYIFFTSGSTGQPKGILGKHEGLDHYFAWEIEQFNISPSDRIGQLASPGSDAMLRNFLLPLCSGATLYLLDQSSQVDIPHWIEENRITILHTVPSLFRLWIKDSVGVNLEKLRFLFLSGESLTRDLVDIIRQQFPKIGEIINTYGPTETTLIKTWYRIPDFPQPGIQPVGFPQPQTEILLLNKAGKLCGIGEPGEIIIRTPFGTLGYLHPEKDLPHSFQPDPWSDHGHPIYKTGDLGCYRLDGNIDFLGRLDRQVKIMGVRIEPDEINAVIENHPAVTSSFVKSFPVEGGDPELCAYLVFQEEGANIVDIRTYLAKNLPASMVPKIYQVLDTLPLLPNGKVASNQLLPPKKPPSVDSGIYLPESPALKQLLQKWKTVLGVEEIHVEDNFFDLGGYSLQMIELISNTEEITGIKLPIAAFYEHPTIKRLFEEIQTAQTLSKGKNIIPLQNRGEEKPLFLIHWAGGFISAYRKFASLLSSFPVFGIQTQDFKISPSGAASIQAIAALYLQQVKELDPHGPYRLAGASMGGKIAFEMARQLSESGDTVEFVGLIDSRAQRTTPSLSTRIQSHKKNISRNSLPATVRYLWKRASIRILRLYYHLCLRAGFAPPHVSNLHLFHLEMSRLYRPSFYTGKITLFRAARQRDDSVPGSFLGWDEFAQSVETFEIPGSHTSLLEYPGVEMLARVMQQKLAGKSYAVDRQENEQQP